MAEEVKKAEKASRFVRSRIEGFSRGEDRAVSAALAILRRGCGKTPGSIPALWAVTYRGMPDELIGSGKDPTRAEWAVHIALTLFALHQQGTLIKERCMNQEGQHLGIALRKLVKKEDDEARIKRRFDAAATSDGVIMLSNHLRGLVQLLKRENIALDYERLTKNIYWYQIPDERDSVRLNWGRDFYRGTMTQDENKEEETNE